MAVVLLALNTFFWFFVAELLRQVAYANRQAVLTLYDHQGRTVNLDCPLAANTPSTPYRLEVSGDDSCNGNFPCFQS